MILFSDLPLKQFHVRVRGSNSVVRDGPSTTTKTDYTAYTACIAFIVYTAYKGIYAYMYCYIVRALTFWLNDL